MIKIKTLLDIKGLGCPVRRHLHPVFREHVFIFHYNKDFYRTLFHAKTCIFLFCPVYLYSNYQ